MKNLLQVMPTPALFKGHKIKDEADVCMLSLVTGAHGMVGLGRPLENREAS